MTSLEEIKQQILDANEAVSEPIDVYHEAARKIVNIERQAFYGTEQNQRRLGKIRETINELILRGKTDEV